MKEHRSLKSPSFSTTVLDHAILLAPVQYQVSSYGCHRSHDEVSAPWLTGDLNSLYENNFQPVIFLTFKMHPQNFIEFCCLSVQSVNSA